MEVEAGVKSIRWENTDKILNGSLGVIALLIVSFFWDRTFIAVSALGVIGILMLRIRDNRPDTILFILAGLGGAVAEIIAIYFGAWNYAKPQLYGIPYWLPILWGIAALWMVIKKELIQEVLEKYSAEKS